MKIRLLIPGLLVSVPAFAWQPQTGDIIFQISRSSQSKAIQLATHSDYSHTGMLVMRNKKPYVFEAVGPVKYTRSSSGLPMVKRANTLFAALKAD